MLSDVDAKVKGTPNDRPVWDSSAETGRAATGCSGRTRSRCPPWPTCRRIFRISSPSHSGSTIRGRTWSCSPGSRRRSCTTRVQPVPTAARSVHHDDPEAARRASSWSFTDVKLDVAIPDAEFAFQAPPGANVEDEVAKFLEAPTRRRTSEPPRKRTRPPRPKTRWLTSPSPCPRPLLRRNEQEFCPGSASTGRKRGPGLFRDCRPARA